MQRKPSESPRAEVLTRLLESHERSVSYGRPAPWPRDVILRFDAKTFPRAFSPEGRERRAALLGAVHQLELEKCVRVVRHPRGPLTGETKEIRLGPDEVEAAYDAVKGLGFEPLAVGLQELRELAARLAEAASAPDWMRDYLRRLGQVAEQGDVSLVGMQRERFKRERQDVSRALTAAAALASGVAPAWERVISERIFRDSKVLGRVRTQVVEVLVRADPRWEGVPPEEALELLEAYGVRRKPGLIRCAGVAALHVGSSVYRLEDFQPVAHLPDAWGAALVDAVIASGFETVTTIENEYPFLSYVEEAGGHRGLLERRDFPVYIAGFPTPALVETLALLARRGRVSFRHWGDADVGGVRIWRFLRARLGCPVQLFRTTAAWVQRESEHGGKALTPLERHALARLRKELSGEAASSPDVGAACELIDALLACGLKLEQERY